MFYAHALLSGLGRGAALARFVFFAFRGHASLNPSKIYLAAAMVC
jgi:hypothetical protein